MCNCKEEVEAKLLEKYAGTPGENHKIEIVGYGLMIKDGVMQLRPVLPIEHTFDHTLKNGKVKRKKVHISFALSHCPFCGVKIEEE